jgi:hypothetical protein
MVAYGRQRSTSDNNGLALRALRALALRDMRSVPLRSTPRTSLTLERYPKWPRIRG